MREKVETRYGGVKKKGGVVVAGREGFFLFFSFPSLIVGSRVLRQSGRGLPGDFYGTLCNLVCPLDKRAKPDYFSPTEFIMRGKNTPILADYDKGEIIGVPEDKLRIPVVKAGFKRKFAIVMMLRIRYV